MRQATKHFGHCSKTGSVLKDNHKSKSLLLIEQYNHWSMCYTRIREKRMYNNFYQGKDLIPASLQLPDLPAGEADNPVPLFPPHPKPKDDFVMAEVGVVIHAAVKKIIGHMLRITHR